MGIKNTWGGRRANAGKKNLAGKHLHQQRSQFSEHKPHLVVLSFRRHITLSRKTLLKLCHNAFKGFQTHKGRVLHFTLNKNELMILIECTKKEEFFSAIKSLNIRLAKNINKALRIKYKKLIQGSVFYGRYQLRALNTLKSYKNALKRLISTNAILYKKPLFQKDVFCSLKSGIQKNPLLIKRVFKTKNDVNSNPRTTYLGPPLDSPSFQFTKLLLCH